MRPLRSVQQELRCPEPDEDGKISAVLGKRPPTTLSSCPSAPQHTLFRAMLRALLLTAFAASSSLAFVSRAPLPKLAPRAAPARPPPLMMPAFLKKVGFSKPIPRTGVKKAVHWLGSTLALPGLAMATLAVATPPPDAMVQLASFTKVWQRFVPALTYKFLAVVGVVYHEIIQVRVAALLLALLLALLRRLFRGAFLGVLGPLDQPAAHRSRAGAVAAYG